jgi:hypothetical protein
MSLTQTSTAVREDGDESMSRIAHRGRIAGRYYLDKWFDTEFGKQVPPCIVKTLLPDAATFDGAVPAVRGDRSFIHLPNGIGLLRGRIARVIGSTMTMSIEHATEQQRNRLAAHILWFDQMSHVPSSDRRSFPRFRPADPYTVFATGDGKVEPCELVDISPSGAAVRSIFRPDIEGRVILGQIAGIIARHMDWGFAVKFNHLQNPAILDDMLAPPEHLKSIVPFRRPAEQPAAPEERPAAWREPPPGDTEGHLG